MPTTRASGRRCRRCTCCSRTARRRCASLAPRAAEDRGGSQRDRWSRSVSGLRELLPDDRIVVLENTRFNPGETKNDRRLCASSPRAPICSSHDAFGSAHRAHASTVGVAQLVPAYAGSPARARARDARSAPRDVERPFLLISGGAKVEDKLGVLRNLGGRADQVLIGGKMAEELRESNPLEFEVVLPRDVVAASTFEPDAETREVAYEALPEGWLGLDIGPETRRDFGERIRAAKTVFWNGPMGVFEWPRSRRERAPSRRPCPRCTGTPSSAARTRRARCTSSGSRTRSTGSRRAAALRSSCWRGRNCQALP